MWGGNAEQKVEDKRKELRQRRSLRPARNKQIRQTWTKHSWLSSKDKTAAKRSGKARNAPLWRDELTHSPLAGLWPAFSTVLQAKLVTHTHLQLFHKNVHEWDMQMVVGFMAHVSPVCAPYVSMLMTE